jgi:pilus assembly protein Flp/PilA
LASLAAVLSGTRSNQPAVFRFNLANFDKGATERQNVFWFGCSESMQAVSDLGCSLCSGTNVGSHLFFPSEEDMKNFVSKVQRFLKSEDGPTAVEYAIMLALIVVVCLTAIGSIGSSANSQFNSIATSLN